MRVAFDATATSAASTTAKTCIRVLCKLPYAATLTPGSPNAAPLANKVKCSGKTKRSILTSCAQTFARETNAQSARAVDPASHHDFGSCRRCLRHPSRSTTPQLFVSADGWMDGLSFFRIHTSSALSPSHSIVHSSSRSVR
mmetsp:Transcript_265/g.492  ORF Transcript_265/g.492 Transcript_265/m.492 type:complete len:141 (+) Transcript_265:497-919(+)